MKRNLQKMITGLTMMSFSFFSAIPASAAKAPPTKSVMAQVVENYNNAPKDKGSAAFVDAFLAKGEKQDKAQMRNLMVGHVDYPSLKLLDEQRAELSGKAGKMVIELRPVSDGVVFLVNSKEFKFERSKTLEQNARALEKLLDAKEISLLNWIIPEAQALSNTWGWILIGVGVLAAAFGIYHLAKNNDVVKVNPGNPFTGTPPTVEHQ